jgi:hypothetical protein
MAAKAWIEDELASEMLAEERLRTIEWSHPSLASLSHPARVIYASLIDGCSTEAREMIAGVDLVWRNRAQYRDAATTTDDRRTIADSICGAVHELLSNGLLLLLDDRTISGGWVRRPWEGLPN